MNDICFYEIKRETSKYNKYMKYHVSFYREDMSLLSSEYFKTQREANTCVANMVEIGRAGFPVGDKIHFTEYRPIKN